jgi:hypothetical protein
MLKEGTYAARFKTPAGEGTGVAHLKNGNVTGAMAFLATPARTKTMTVPRRQSSGRNVIAQSAR